MLAFGETDDIRAQRCMQVCQVPLVARRIRKLSQRHTRYRLYVPSGWDSGSEAIRKSLRILRILRATKISRDVGQHQRSKCESL